MSCPEANATPLLLTGGQVKYDLRGGSNAGSYVFKESVIPLWFVVMNPALLSVLFIWFKNLTLILICSYVTDMSGSSTLTSQTWLKREVWRKWPHCGLFLLSLVSHNTTLSSKFWLGGWGRQWWSATRAPTAEPRPTPRFHQMCPLSISATAMELIDFTLVNVCASTGYSSCPPQQQICKASIYARYRDTTQQFSTCRSSGTGSQTKIQH